MNKEEVEKQMDDIIEVMVASDAEMRLTRRFCAYALTGICANPHSWEATNESVAKAALDIAIEMTRVVREHEADFLEVEGE